MNIYPQVSEKVRNDIAEWLECNVDDMKEGTAECETDHSDDDPMLELTVSCDDNGDSWAFQTGDTSFHGACYFHPHWAKIWVGADTDHRELVIDIIDQLNDCLADAASTL